MFYRGIIEEKQGIGYTVNIPEVGTVTAEVCKIKGIDIEYFPKEVVYLARVGEDSYVILGCLESNSSNASMINTNVINSFTGKLDKIQIGTTNSDVLGKVAYYFETTLNGGNKNA